MLQAEQLNDHVTRDVPDISADGDPPQPHIPTLRNHNAFWGEPAYRQTTARTVKQVVLLAMHRHSVYIYNSSEDPKMPIILMADRKFAPRIFFYGKAW